MGVRRPSLIRFAVLAIPRNGAAVPAQIPAPSPEAYARLLRIFPRGAILPHVEKAKSVRAIDITPDGPGIVVDTAAGEVFIPAEDAAVGIATLGWIVVTPPRLGIETIEPMAVTEEVVEEWVDEDEIDE